MVVLFHPGLDRAHFALSEHSQPLCQSHAVSARYKVLTNESESAVCVYECMMGKSAHLVLAF